MVIAARSTPIVCHRQRVRTSGARADRRARALERQRQDDLTILSQYRRCLRSDYLECREVSKIINPSLMAARTVYRKNRCYHLATQLLNMGQDRAVSDDQTRHQSRTKS